MREEPRKYKDPIQTAPGKWYWGFRCIKCNKSIAVAEDTSEGRAPYPAQSGSYGRNCRYCGKSGDYQVAGIESFKAA